MCASMSRLKNSKFPPPLHLLSETRSEIYGCKLTGHQPDTLWQPHAHYPQGFLAPALLGGTIDGLLCSRNFPDSSVGKESTCNAGDPSWISGSGRSDGVGIGYPLQYSCGSAGKESACNMGDLGSFPGLRRSPGRGHGNPLQYSCLENLMDRGAWWAQLKGSQRVRHD